MTDDKYTGYDFTRDDELKIIREVLERIFTPEYVEKVISTVEEVWDTQKDNSEEKLLYTFGFNTQGFPDLSSGHEDYYTKLNIKLVSTKEYPSKVLTPEKEEELMKKYRE